MGSCVSIHKNTGSALKLQMSSLDDSKDQPNSNSIHSSPIKDAMDAKSGSSPKLLMSSSLDDSKVQPSSNSISSTAPIKDAMDNKPRIPTPAIVDPRILSLRYKSQASRLSSASIASSYRSFGSKEEAFYDTQAWLESDCDDDFYSVNGDLSSRGSTPTHSAVATPRINKVFSPQVSQGRTWVRSGSNLSRGITPSHNRNSSSPQITGTYSEVVPTSNQISSTAPKKKRLADLFRESIRERAGEFLALEEGIENQSDQKKEARPRSPASVLPPKSGNRTPFVSGPLSQSSSGKITPADEYFPDREKPLRSPQCCFPRLSYIRSFREHKKGSNPSTPSDLSRAG